MIETKIQDRDQIAQNIKETTQQKIKTEQEWSKLTAERQKLEQERIAADRTVMAASQDTLKKREASNRDPENIGTKNLLIVAEQIEGLARQVVQRYAEKLADLNKLIVTHTASIENLNAEIPELNARTEQLTTEHQQLIAQRNQATKDKDAKLAKIQGANTEILTIEKQLEVLNKTVQDHEKISAAEKEVVTKTLVKRSQLAGRLKKWKAASINTTLIKARSELAVLASLNKDDPSNESKIIAHRKKCDDLSLRYQAAKQ
jgi:chromosome segregation ATPase